MSKPTHTLVLTGPAQQRLTVQAVGRIRPDATNTDDGNWLRTTVQLQTGQFAGAATCSIRTDDLSDFREGLARLTDDRSATATFKTMEDQLGIVIIGDGRGGLTIQGHVADTANRLAFAFQGDQGGLPQVLETIDAILAHYPVG